MDSVCSDVLSELLLSPSEVLVSLEDSSTEAPFPSLLDVAFSDELEFEAVPVLSVCDVLTSSTAPELFVSFEVLPVFPEAASTSSELSTVDDCSDEVSEAESRLEEPAISASA